MKQAAINLWVAIKVCLLTIFLLGNAEALVSFSNGIPWKHLISIGVLTFLVVSPFFLLLVPVLFAFFLLGKKLNWNAEEFLFYTGIFWLSLTLAVFLLSSPSEFIILENHEGVLPEALLASGIAIFIQKRALYRLAQAQFIPENFSTHDNSSDSSTNLNQ